MSREAADLRGGAAAGFSVTNDWLAGGEVLVGERLRASARVAEGVNVLDLEYVLTPTADVRLARWAFSGFCVRTRGDGKVEAFGPEGPVGFAKPSHLKPEADWPAAAWYAYVLHGGVKTAGVVVVDHPQNPPSPWHNHRDNRMLNPCVVAPREVTPIAGQPLVPRYRVLAFDGEPPREAVARLAAAFRKE